MDECWLDVSGTENIFGSPEKVANDIRETIKFELGLTISVGVSFNGESSTSEAQCASKLGCTQQNIIITVTKRDATFPSTRPRQKPVNEKSQ